MGIFGNSDARSRMPFASLFNPTDWAIHENTGLRPATAERVEAAGMRPEVTSDGSMPARPGIFGAPLVGDQASGLAQSFDPMIAAGQRMAAQMAPAPSGYQPRKRTLADNLGLLADAFGNTNANRQALMAREEGERSAWQAEQRRQQDRAWQVEDRDAKLYAPQWFNSGRNRVQLDPRTGEAKVVYDGPEDYEEYAAALGIEPTDPRYPQTVQDYILRSNGPTAYGFDVGLENVRQGNRERMEGVRQGNRLALRQTPTYANLHPRQSGGGGQRPPRAQTMAGTMAPILAKVARGEQLTPAEQQAWSMYRPGRGSKGGAGGSKQPVKVSTPEQARALPPGTVFQTPDGRVKVR